eukprot:PhM_4_TR11629/c3_g1_i1/m.57236
MLLVLYHQLLKIVLAFSFLKKQICLNLEYKKSHLLVFSSALFCFGYISLFFLNLFRTTTSTPSSHPRCLEGTSWHVISKHRQGLDVPLHLFRRGCTTRRHRAQHNPATETTERVR